MMPQPAFLQIVQLHHLQALLQLGLLANPHTGKPNPPNPEKARHELALLEILREKTAGNLSAEELETLDNIIAQVRVGLGE